MDIRIFQPSALLVYRNALTRLMEDDWHDSKLPNYIELLVSQNNLQNGLFFKTMKNGVLDLLGSIFFNQILAIEDDLICCDIETAFIRTNELYFLLDQSGIKDDKLMLNFLLSIVEIEDIYDEVSEEEQNEEYFRRQTNYRVIDAIHEIMVIHKNEIDTMRDLYSRNFAERAFHDRQLCEYISFVFYIAYGEKGYPIFSEIDKIRFEKVIRKDWPSWVRFTLLSRERGMCANCYKSFIDLQADSHIDHIVPLVLGGCNDLVNLQLLCDECNRKKKGNKKLVNSSIPNYLHWKK